MLAPGTSLGPYRIVALIGRGGMGEVYRACDCRLGRDVAIKLLPSELALDPERLGRFEQEARAVASLSHANIVALYDVGTHQGAPYLVTEFLEGESLQHRLRVCGLPMRKAIEFGVQIAQGLAAAHEKGIVHRDLKPANVFVTRDGGVKILDFGIAKATRPAQGPEGAAVNPEPSTETGPFLGTVGYMSPEQVRGRSVDPRSDIFSFGCVLYEMLGGAAPFQRETTADTVSAILREEPAPLSRVATERAAGLDRVVRRCLEKRPEERFSSAHDLALALEAVSGSLERATAAPAGALWHRRRMLGLAAAGVTLLAVVGVLAVKLMPAAPRVSPPGLRKILVLPFENLGAPEDTYFASGMTNEIINRLASVAGLGVISQTTAAHFGRSGKTAKEIGSELGVAYVLEGSVRWEHLPGHKSTVRIAPQLIRVADDTSIWAGRYDRTLADVLATQSEVAESVAEAMGVELLPPERAKLKRISTDDVEAYDLYLHGLEAERGGMDRRDYEGALRMYRAAVARDPRFAQALAGLAEMRLLMYWAYYDRSPERLIEAREAAERSVELRPDLAETHAALGFYFYQGLLDYPRALEQFAAALKLQPSFSAAYAGTAYVVRRQGRWERSVEELSKALEFDPKNAKLLQNFAQSCVLARRYADADHALKSALALNPESSESRSEAAWLQVEWHGDVEQAQAILDEAIRVRKVAAGEGVLARAMLRVAIARHDYDGALRLLAAQSRPAFDELGLYVPIALLRGEVEAAAGRSEPARRAFAAARLELEEKVKLGPEDGRYRSSLGIAYAGLGQRDEAMREAKRAFDLLPASKDAWSAVQPRRDLALVYVMLGLPDEAIATLADVLAWSGEMTPNELRLDPRWKPLLSNPRFQTLLEKYEVR